MKRSSVFRFPGPLAGLLLAALLAAGCATVPEGIAPLPDEPPDRARILADPDAALGATVVWGGVIATIDNTAEGTDLEIVARELDRSARPREIDRSEGRFRVSIPQFLDPQVYAPGREVTVRGRIAGVEEDAIGEHPYRFVVLQAQAIHLWARRPPERVHYDPWPYGYYGPYWRHHPYYWRHDPWRYDPWYW